MLLLLIAFVGFTSLSLLMLGKTHREGSLSSTMQEAIEKHTIIAKYIFNDTANKELANLLRQELFLDRMHTLVKYEYIYYSPSEYSDCFYINDDVFISSKITSQDSAVWVKEHLNYWDKNFIIVGNGDTLLKSMGAISGIKKIPDVLRVYTNGIHIGSFGLKYIYEDNLKDIPSTPLLERFSLGPFCDKYYY